MKRACDSCLKRPGTRQITVKGVAFLVCTGCAPTIPVRGRRVA